MSSINLGEILLQAGRLKAQRQLFEQRRFDQQLKRQENLREIQVRSLLGRTLAGESGAADELRLTAPSVFQELQKRQFQRGQEVQQFQLEQQKAFTAQEREQSSRQLAVRKQEFSEVESRRDFRASQEEQRATKQERDAIGFGQVLLGFGDKFARLPDSVARGDALLKFKDELPSRFSSQIPDDPEEAMDFFKRTVSSAQAFVAGRKNKLIGNGSGFGGLPRAVRSRLTLNKILADKLLGDLGVIEKKVENNPEFLNLFVQGVIGFQNILERVTGASFNEKQRSAFSSFRNLVQFNINSFLKEATGASRTMGEIKFLSEALLQKDISFNDFMARLKEIQTSIRRHKRIYERALSEGSFANQDELDVLMDELLTSEGGTVSGEGSRLQERSGGSLKTQAKRAKSKFDQLTARGISLEEAEAAIAEEFPELAKEFGFEPVAR